MSHFDIIDEDDYCAYWNTLEAFEKLLPCISVKQVREELENAIRVMKSRDMYLLDAAEEVAADQEAEDHIEARLEAGYVAMVSDQSRFA